MKTDAYFAFSVAVALVVPALLGGLYFGSLLDKYSNSTLLPLGEANREIVLLGDTVVSEFHPRDIEVSGYEGANHIDFEVRYLSGSSDFTNYDLSLDHIDLSANIIPGDMTWELQKYDSELGYFKKEREGKFDDVSKITLIEDEPIELSKIEQYRLYYYISGAKYQYNRGTISAVMVLE